MSTEGGHSSDVRRHLILALAIGLGVASGMLSWKYGQAGSAKFAAAACGRIALTMAALWLAWPSLRRPAQWLPPGMAVAGVILLAVLAAQPRLVIVAIPAFGLLLALATVIRMSKR